jgi:hypothetical protein
LRELFGFSLATREQVERKQAADPKRAAAIHRWFHTGGDGVFVQAK